MQFSSKLAFSLAAAPGNKTKKDKRALWKAFSLHKKNKCFPALFYRACVRYLILFTWVTNHHGFVLSCPVPAAGLQAFSHCREVLSHSSGSGSLCFKTSSAYSAAPAAIDPETISSILTFTNSCNCHAQVLTEEMRGLKITFKCDQRVI